MAVRIVVEDMLCGGAVNRITTKEGICICSFPVFVKLIGIVISSISYSLIQVIMVSDPTAVLPFYAGHLVQVFM